MSVYKRGRIWWIKTTINGVVVRRSAKTTNKAEAQALEKSISGSEPGSTTYLDALTLWMPIAPKSMHSHARNTHELYHFPLKSVPAEANKLALKMLNRGLSPLTVNRRLAVIKRVLKLAYTDWDLINAPLDQKISKLSEKGTSREYYLSVSEVDDLIAACDNPVAQRMILTAAYTGLRRGELFSLTPASVLDGYVTVYAADAKSGRGRAVILSNRLDNLSDWLPFQITEHELRKSWEAARLALKMPWLRFHDLRHTFASWLVTDSRVPDKLVQEALGHSSLAVTSKYGHLRGRSMDSIRDALDNVPKS